VPAVAWAPGARAVAHEDTVYVNQRPVVTLRATLMGRSAALRAARAAAALQAAIEHGGPWQVSVWNEGETFGLKVDEAIAFYLVPDDLAEGAPLPLAASAQQVRARLQAALDEVHEMRDPRRLAEGAALVLLATLLAYGLARLVFSARRALMARSQRALVAASGEPIRHVAPYLRRLMAAMLGAATWLALLLLADLWVTFVLGRFAYTRPWADRSRQWLLGLVEQFAVAIAAAVPGLLTALLIFGLARLVAQAAGAFMQRVEAGELQVGWLDRDTAGPTRRVGIFVVWLFALAIAYPFLPGASSDAFKGVSVLAGLMLSLGATGVVGQVASGLSLMYSRTLRSGEYVRIGETEGTVSGIGLFSTRLHTGMGEEVSLPNSVVFSQPVRNYSRLVQDGWFVLHTGVTIGYATPWRLVHEMLLEAARRTQGIAADPAPYVRQTALSDFYIEYRLCAQADRSAPRRRAEVIHHLHANIQDVFNENGVQIMSPHYRADPPQPQIVPPEARDPGLRRPPAG
jgi:small-conductance mechanosensitive channel